MYTIKMIHSYCTVLTLDYVMFVCRHIARFCESYMRGVASKATTSIEQLLNSQITKFTDFEVIYLDCSRISLTVRLIDNLCALLP